MDPRGFPLALAYACPENTDAGGAAEGARVTLAWSNRRETFGEQTVSMKDVDAGDYLHRFGSPAISTKREQARFADILKAQCAALPLRLTPALSGWGLTPAGAPRYVLEDRESWWRLDDAGQLALDGAKPAPDLPTLEDAAFLANAWTDWSPDGRGLAALAFTIRGLFASLQRVGSSMVLTGETGSGKTTVGRFCLGVLGAVPAHARPTLTFTASAAAMKAKRAWRNDLPSVFDDFHKLAGEGSAARLWDAMDAILRAVADGDEWNARGTRTGGLREPVYLKGADIFTGELIEGFLTSAERRMVWIGYTDDRNSDDLYAAWDTLQGIWERIGHAVIRQALPVYAQAGETPGEKLRAWLDRLDSAWEAAIFDTLAAAMPAAPQKFTRSIAKSWAPILSGAAIADQAVGAAEGDGPFVESLRPVLARLALRQLERLTAGAGTAEFDADFFRLCLTPDNLLADAETGAPFTSTESADAPWLMPIGYQWAAAFGGGFTPSGRHFTGWRHRSRGEDWILPDAFLLAAQRRARALGLAFPFTAQTLPGHLARIGFLLPGDDGRHTATVRTPAGKARALRIPIEAAEPLPAEAGENPEPGAIARSGLSPLSPLVPAAFSRAGTEKPALNQSPVGVVPAVPALKRKSSRETPTAGHARENIKEIATEAPERPTEPVSAGQVQAHREPAKRPPAATGGAARRQRVQTTAVIVLDREGAAISYGGATTATEPHHAATDPSRVKKARGAKKGEALAALLEWAKAKGAEQIVITRSWAQAASLPAEDQIGAEGVAHAWAELPAKSRWALRQPGLLRWSTWATPAGGGRTIEILLACYDPRITLGEETAGDLAASLALFREATAGRGRGGFSYRQGPGRTFLNTWQLLARDPGALDISQDLAPADFPPPAHAVPEPAADLGWMRPPTLAERDATTCVVIDANSQYLRAMAGLVVGLGAPGHYDPAPEFDRRRFGYWRLSWAAPAWPATLPAAGWPLAAGADGWLTTETVALLADQRRGDLAISEAWLWEHSGRALDRLQERLRAGLYRLKADADAGVIGAAGALQLLKAVYKSGVGSWSIRENRPLERPEPAHRPHFRHAIIARSTALLLRDLATKTGGAHPVAIATDALAFLTDKPVPDFLAGLALQIGPKLGQYTLERAFPAAAMLAALDDLEAARASFDAKRLGLARAAVFRLITGKGDALMARKPAKTPIRRSRAVWPGSARRPSCPARAPMSAAPIRAPCAPSNAPRPPARSTPGPGGLCRPGQAARSARRPSASRPRSGRFANPPSPFAA